MIDMVAAQIPNRKVRRADLAAVRVRPAGVASLRSASVPSSADLVWGRTVLAAYRWLRLVAPTG
jgi:hypothetical protein